ncbi:hypothetical protein [Planococcus alpniumensis]|uniref:hypothetical protein n=1 Tax=Planococcus alpniumensis TaxID=2708345 RepID=UPI003FA24EC7
MTILETERLWLKPYQADMADSVYAVIQKREIADTMLMVPHPYPRKQLDGWLDYVQKTLTSATPLNTQSSRKTSLPAILAIADWSRCQKPITPEKSAISSILPSGGRAMRQKRADECWNRHSLNTA